MTAAITSTTSTQPRSPTISTLSLHDALPISRRRAARAGRSHRVRHRGLRSEPRQELAERAPGAPHHPHHGRAGPDRSEEHTSELQSHSDLVCRLLLEKKILGDAQELGEWKDK